MHLNGDEAMCFGASYIAANSSSSFKVKKVYLTQHPAFEYKLVISPLSDSVQQGSNDKVTYNKEATIFSRSDSLGAKKTIALSYDRDVKL